MSEYTDKANEFLAKSGINFTAVPLGVGKHFSDDKKLRARYELTLTRTIGEKSVSFDFGQSIIGTEKRKRPSAYDLLACLAKYDPDTFENFCEDFGYDTDSRKGLETYLAVQEEWNKVRRFFSTTELEELQEIQ